MEEQDILPLVRTRGNVVTVIAFCGAAAYVYADYLVTLVRADSVTVVNATLMILGLMVPSLFAGVIARGWWVVALPLVAVPLALIVAIIEPVGALGRGRGLGDWLSFVVFIPLFGSLLALLGQSTRFVADPANVRRAKRIPARLLRTWRANSRHNT